MKYPHSTPDSDMAKEPASPSVFTPSQLALLRMFSRDKSEEKAIEIQQVLTKYFREKADKALDALWSQVNLISSALMNFAKFMFVIS